MLPPGAAMDETSLIVNCLAVARTLEASDWLTCRNAAVLGEDPSMTHTSRPPRMALPSRRRPPGAGRASRSHILHIGLQCSFCSRAQDSGVMTERLQRECARGSLQCELWVPGVERTLASGQERGHARGVR